MASAQLKTAIASAVASLAVMSFGQEAPPRLRTLLDNGSTLLVENLPHAKSVSVQLFASTLRLPDTSEDHGFRHLLEHLCLKGSKHDLDRRLESQGMFLLGRTLRDAMQIEVDCLPDQIPVALDALEEVMQPIDATDADIRAEVSIMKQEDALQADAQRLSRAAWTEAFGESGLDPFGDLDIMSKATAAGLTKYQRTLFSANGLVLVISGPVDVEAETKRGSAFLSARPALAQGPISDRPGGVPGRLEVTDAFGEARAARVPSFRDPKAAWALAAALAVASQLENAFVIYTPSAQSGLVMVGKTDESSGVGLKIDEMEEGDVAAAFPLGKVLARRWVLRQLEQPATSAFIRGLLLCGGPSYNPEQMLENLASMTWRDFFKGFRSLSHDSADIIVGTRR